MSMLLDALGYMGDLLDKPGRSARALVHGLTGGSGDDLAAAIPFSDTMGFTDKANRVSGNEMLGAEDDGSIFSTLRGLGAEVATDPLTLAGGALGRMLGGRAAEAAVARGPRYETTADDLARMLGEAGMTGDTSAYRRFSDLASYPQRDRVLSEIAPNSKILGAGAEGVAFTDPSGKVTRIGRQEVGAPGRPESSSVLQASSAIDIGEKGSPGWRVERTPTAGHVADANYWLRPEQGSYSTRQQTLSKKLEAQGLNLGDPHIGNLGTSQGRPVVIDPGAVDVQKGFGGEISSVGQATDPGRLMAALLNSVGSDDAVRTAYARGLSGPSFGRKFGAYGAAGGADAGILARMLAGD